MRIYTYKQLYKPGKVATVCKKEERNIDFVTIISANTSWHLSGCFLGIRSSDFSGFCQGASNHYEVLHDNPIFWKTCFAPKIGEMGQK